MDWLSEDSAQVKKIKLEKFRFAVGQLIDKMVIHDAQVDIFEDYLPHRIALHFSASILGEGQESLNYKYPRDWWQAFKLRWFPQWALKRWPAEFTKIKVDVKTLYPKLNISLPDNHHVVYLQDHNGNRAKSSFQRVGVNKPLWE